MKKLIRLFNNLRYAGVGNLDKYDNQRFITTGINVICLVIITLNIIAGSIVFYLNNNLPIFIGALAEAAIAAIIIFFNSKKKYTIGTVGFYTIINASTLYFAALLGPSAQVQITIFPIVSLIYFNFSRLSIRTVCISITIGLLILLELNFYYNIIKPVPEKAEVSSLIRWLAYAAVISILITINWVYTRKMRSSLSAEEKRNKVKTLLFQHYSHDIRGAYFGVSSICALLESNKNKSPEVITALIDPLVNASEYYKNILDHFLEYSKSQADSLDTIYPEEFNINQEFSRIITLNTYLALENEVKIDYQVDPDFPETLWQDKLKVTRIFMNLLNNAIKFSRHGSTVTVIVYRDEIVWKLVVTDQGEGIPLAKQNEIFDAFFTEQTSQNPEGTGLGLYITKYLVDLLKGKIQVKSTMSVGTSFEVSLPLEAE